MEGSSKRSTLSRQHTVCHLVRDVLTAFIHRGIQDGKMQEAKRRSLNQKEHSISVNNKHSGNQHEAAVRAHLDEEGHVAESDAASFSY